MFDNILDLLDVDTTGWHQESIDAWEAYASSMRELISKYSDDK